MNVTIRTHDGKALVTGQLVAGVSVADLHQAIQRLDLKFEASPEAHEVPKPAPKQPKAERVK